MILYQIQKFHSKGAPCTCTVDIDNFYLELGAKPLSEMYFPRFFEEIAMLLRILVQSIYCICSTLDVMVVQEELAPMAGTFLSIHKF